jgi:hypothetical protein
MATERKLPEVGEEIHLPGPSAQPLMLAVGSTIALLGVTQPKPIFFIVGIAIVIITLFKWIRDAIAEFKALPDSHGDHGHADHGHAADGHGETTAPAPADH